MKQWFTREELDEEDYKSQQWKEFVEQYKIRQNAKMFCEVGLLVIMLSYLIFSNAAQNQINKFNQNMAEIEAQAEAEAESMK